VFVLFIDAKVWWSTTSFVYYIIYELSYLFCK